MTREMTAPGAAVNGMTASVPSALVDLMGEAVGSPPATPRGQRTYATILATAERAFVEGDYHAVSIDRIASESNVSVGSVYRYFGSKEGLFLVVLANVLGEMYEAARRVWTMPWGYRERLEASTAEYLRAFLRNRQVLGSAAHLGMTSERVREMSWAMRRLVHTAMAKRLVEDQSESTLEPLDAQMLMKALAAMVDGYAYRAYASGEFGPQESSPANVKKAAKALAGVWYRSVFGDEVRS